MTIISEDVLPSQPAYSVRFVIKLNQFQNFHIQHRFFYNSIRSLFCLRNLRKIIHAQEMNKVKIYLHSTNNYSKDVSMKFHITIYRVGSKMTLPIKRNNF